MTGEVAGGPDAGIGRAEEVVDHHEPAVVDLDTRGRQPDVAGAGRAPDGDQEAREGHLSAALEVEHPGPRTCGLDSGDS